MSKQPENLLEKYKKFHFIGVGGSGMSAIATVLVGMGFEVSGSDINTTEVTERLKKQGIQIFQGHQFDNINKAEAVVVSTAIGATNPELQFARTHNLPVFHRSDLMSALMDQYQGIAVAGAHGKTTTTSMLSLLLTFGELDPTVLIGGDLDYIGGNARLGKGKYLVAEADESDGSFTRLNPHIAIITNIENDHLDYYHNMDNILSAFQQFLQKLSPETGIAVVCFDCSHIREIATRVERKFVSYGINPGAEFTARNIESNGAYTQYDVFRNEKKLGTVELAVPGMHNVLNSLAAIVTGILLGMDFSCLAKGMLLFKGAKRRFQTKGNIQDIWVVDDYAHHPTEIMTTLCAAKQTLPQRLICVFQPHRYSRTKFLQKEFGGAFGQADIVILTDIYSAGEEPIPEITGKTLQEEIERQTGKVPIYFQNKDDIPAFLEGFLRPGDLVITMGAGNIYRTGEELVQRLEKKN